MVGGLEGRNTRGCLLSSASPLLNPVWGMYHTSCLHLRLPVPWPGFDAGG